jgi:hypothetical protein
MAAYIKKLLEKAAESHPCISGQSTDDDIFNMIKVLYPIFHNANYDMITVAGQVNHNLIGLIQLDMSYTATWVTLDHVYQRRLLLEEYGPKTVYIKDIHSAAADAISWLKYDPSINQTAENFHMTKVKKRSSKCSHRQSWMTVSKHWCNLEIDTVKHKDLNFAFANHREEDEIYLLTTIEIAEAQHKDQELKAYYKKNAIMAKKYMCLQLVEDTKMLCKNGKSIIPASLQHRAVAWYHHYLQHPGHS